MSWETMSKGGNPFRNPVDGHSQPQDSDSKNEEMLNLIELSEWERILDVASRDRSFDPPPKMMVCTPPTLPNSSARKNGGRDIDDAFYGEDLYEPLLYRYHHRQHHRHHDAQHREHHDHHQRQHHHNEKHREHHHHREVRQHRVPNFDQEYTNYSLRLDIGSHDPTSCRVSHPDSRRRATDLSIPALVIPKPTSLTDNRYRRSQSERQWCEDDESLSDQNRWSPKRLMCGMQDNEVVRVAPEFSTKRFPPKREGRPYSSFHSFSSQDKRKSSPYRKIHSQERLGDSGISLPLGFISRSMNPWSPKRLIGGMQDNEVVRVAPEFSKEPSPPKREGHLCSSFHSFSSQNQRKTSPHRKVHLQKRLGDSRRSLPLGFISHLMNSWREEKSVKPARHVSGREWYERSDSMKGKAVSNDPHFMQMVFFDKVGGEPPEEDRGQSCTA